MIENVFGVQKRQWKKWDEVERFTFNSLFDQMMSSTYLFIHPEDEMPHPYHWKTTAWNAAWMAADNLRLLRKRKV